LQWIVDAYTLFLAAFLLPAGALGDRFSRKLMLVLGLGVMAAATVWSATVDASEPLIAARALAGLGAAMVFPATLSTLTAVTSEARRGRAVALWAACVSIGGILGIIGAGLILEHNDWPWIFWTTAIGCGVALILSLVVVVDTKDPEGAHLDPLGTVLSVAAVGGLVLGITEGPARGWTDPLTLVGLIAGALAAVGFVLWEVRARRPLLDVRLFAHPRFGSGSLAIFMLFLATFGAFFLCVQYLAYVFGYGPLDSGLALVPVGITVLPASMVAVVIARKLSVYVTEVVGMVVCGFGLVLLSLLDESSTYLAFAGAFMVFGLGVGLCQTPATEAIVEALPRAKQGVASAVNDTAREMGAALGIAVMGSVFNVGYRAAVGDAALPAALVGPVKESPAVGLAVAQGDPAVVAVVQSSFVDGWVIALWVGAAVVCSGALGVAMIGRRARRRGRLGRDEDEDVLDREEEPVRAAVAVAGVVPVPDEAPVLAVVANSGRRLPPPAPAASVDWLAQERRAAAQGEDDLRAAESSLAALRLLVRQHHLRLERVEQRATQLELARAEMVAVLEHAADELAAIARRLRDGDATSTSGD
jgi:EmrB/QacA subfamily drug resistance transporter